MSGSKRKGSVKRRRNWAGRLFPVIARFLAYRKGIALRGFYRRMVARRGGLVANITLARKLAAVFWRVMVKGMDSVKHGLALTKERCRKPAARRATHGCKTRPATRFGAQYNVRVHGK